MIALFISLVFLAFSASGCWGRHELENLAFVALMGLDAVRSASGESLLPGEAGLEVTMEVIIPLLLPRGGPGTGGGVSSGRTPTVYISLTTPNLTAAVDAAEKSFGRALTASHLQAVIVGEDLARHGLGDVLDMLLRLRSMRHSVMLVVVEGSARAFMERLSPAIEARPSLLARKLLSFTAEGRSTHDLHVHDLLISQNSKSKDAILPLLNLWEERSPGREGSERWSAVVVGGAVFKDAAMVGRLDTTESFHALVLQGSIARVLQSYPITPPQGPGGGGAPATPGHGTQYLVGIEWLKVNTRRKVIIRGAGGGSPDVHIKVDVKLSGNISELPAQIDISKPEGLERLQEEVARGVLYYLRQVVSRAQGEFGGADIFFFGDAARRSFATWGEWISFDWPERFREATVDISVVVSIESPGLAVRNPWRLD